MAGLKIVQANLNKAIKGIKGRTLEGVTDGALLVSEASVPFTPFRTGALRRSRIVTSNGDPDKPQAAIAFTDPKAPRVHEIQLRYRIGGWKFLERPLDQNQRAVFEAIFQKARIR